MSVPKKENPDSDLGKVCHNYLIEEVLKLRKAIREHKNLKNDTELYKILPENQESSAPEGAD